MRTIAAALAALGLLTVVSTDLHAGDGPGPSVADAPVTAVIELFTSQGCSSCPPADSILSGYVERTDTLALAWHVDYWNYLGWRDTFSRAAFSRRQRGYARRMEGGVFTPQVVVNGSAHAVGSRGADVERLSRDARTMPLLPLAITRRDGQINIRLSGTPAQHERVEGAVLSLVRFEREARVVIARGENSGRTVLYRNVVRAVEPVARVSGARLETEIAVTARAGEGCAVVLQSVEDDAPGPILAAATIC